MCGVFGVLQYLNAKLYCLFLANSIMGSRSCFYETSCVSKARKRPLTRNRSNYSENTFPFSKTSSIALHCHGKSSTSYGDLTSNFKRHSMSNMKVPTHSYDCCVCKFFLRLNCEVAIKENVTILKTIRYVNREITLTD